MKLFSKNSFIIVTLFIFIVIVFLFLFNFIDIEYKNSFISIKNIDILSDIRDNRKLDIRPKIILDILNKEKDDDPCPVDIVCFENFSDKKHPFDSLIANLLSGKKAVRIAWYGDSFTEADILVGHLRDTLQSIYGGRGVGLMPIVSQCNAYRNSVAHYFSSWENYNYVFNRNCPYLGINAVVAKPYSGSFVEYKANDSIHNYNKYKNTLAFSQANILYYSQEETEINIKINNQEEIKTILEAHDSVTQYLIKPEKDINTIRLKFPKASKAQIFGVSLEDETGIYIDNFSIKSNTGIPILNLNENYIKQSQKLLKYDLIVLQFGLNIMVQGAVKYDFYEKSMEKVIAKLKQDFGDIPILIISLSDRSTLVSGDYQTMPTVYHLINTQINIASQNKVIFWNLFEAMGGKNSMPKWVNEKNANKDYTHINFNGGKKLAIKLYEAFNFEINNYKKRNIN